MLSSDNAEVNASESPLTQAAPVTHYENFPVASWLCPTALRQPIAAIYAFARTADDIADEGSNTAAERLDELLSFQKELYAIAQGHQPQQRWIHIFGPLQFNMQRHHLPVHLLDDLLSAFIQDIQKSRDHSTYANRAELLDYCRRSANPVGRLLLHLYGVKDEQSLLQSDAICTSLQLINFWQDLSEDIPRHRMYLTDADCAMHGVTHQELACLEVTPNIQKLIASNVCWARELMQSGANLVHRLPGRIGWELRLVVQGGLCILDKVEAQRGKNLHTRLTITKTDAPRLLWRALWM